MPKSGRASLTRQIQLELDSCLCIGQSKHEAKQSGAVHENIYSWSTYRNYMKHCNYFAAYCKEKHGCRTLQECRQYANEWLESRSHLSPSTLKLEVAALSKLYNTTSKDFIETAPRTRDKITRSRGEKVRDKHFSESRHQDFVDFCRATGCRRNELKNLTGDCLVYEAGKPFLRLTVGTKGGRPRTAPVIGENAGKVVSMMQAAGSGLVFETVPGGADIHSYRADYATALYESLARDLKTCKADKFWNKERQKWESCVCWCRGSQKGRWLDKKAMLAVSQALGHNRISIVAGHYIRT